MHRQVEPCWIETCGRTVETDERWRGYGRTGNIAGLTDIRGRAFACAILTSVGESGVADAHGTAPGWVEGQIEVECGEVHLPREEIEDALEGGCIGAFVQLTKEDLAAVHGRVDGRSVIEDASISTATVRVRGTDRRRICPATLIVDAGAG